MFLLLNEDFYCFKQYENTHIKKKKKALFLQNLIWHIKSALDLSLMSFKYNFR